MTLEPVERLPENVFARVLLHVSDLSAASSQSGLSLQRRSRDGR